MPAFLGSDLIRELQKETSVNFAHDLNKGQRKDMLVNEREINMSACKREKEINDIIHVVGVKTLIAPLTSLLWYNSLNLTRGPNTRCC